MNTLLDKMNDEETNNATLFKRKAVAFIKNEEVIEIFNLGYPNKGDFWLKVTDRKKIIPINNVLLEVYIDTSLFRIEIQKYRSLKLDPDQALNCFEKVIGFEDKRYKSSQIKK